MVQLIQSCVTKSAWFTRYSCYFFDFDLLLLSLRYQEKIKGEACSFNFGRLCFTLATQYLFYFQSNVDQWRSKTEAKKDTQ